MTNKKFFSGNSVKQAVLQAARHFQLAPEEVAYEEIERRHGFLKVRRRAVISVNLDQPRREPGDAGAASSQDEPEDTRATEMAEVDRDVSEMETEVLPIERDPMPEVPRATKEPAKAEEPEQSELPEDGPFSSASAGRPVPDPAFSGDRIEAAEESIRRLLELGGLELQAEVNEREHEGERRLEVELRGQDENLLLDDRGRILMSIQHLLPRLMRGLTGESMPCLVDCDNFHEIRAEQLRHLAQRVAAEVRDSERSQMLEPMAPDERRIVHLTLADDPAVETASQGNGLFKRVQVRPTRSLSSGFDR